MEYFGRWFELFQKYPEIPHPSSLHIEVTGGKEGEEVGGEVGYQLCFSVSVFRDSGKAVPLENSGKRFVVGSGDGDGSVVVGDVY